MKKTTLLTLILIIAINFGMKAQTWDERPTFNLVKTYEQDFTTKQWDDTLFYSQWATIVSDVFTATDIADGYLQFVWIPKRIVRSKEVYKSPYTFEAKIGYGTGTNRGGLVVRANLPGEAVQEPATTDPGFNSEGVAFYPTEDGSAMIIQFTGTYSQYKTLGTRIEVPKPDDVTSLKGENTFRIEDYGTSIYVFLNDKPYIRVDLTDIVGTIFTSGTVYNSQMAVAGTFTAMVVSESGKVVVCQRDAALRLYSAKIQTRNIKKQTISFDAIGAKKVDDEPFMVNAVASSGLAVTYTLVSGPATLADKTVTLTGEVGVVNILVSQVGNDNYLPVTLNLTFYVSKPNSEISSVPVTGLLLCCRGNDRGTYLVEGKWNPNHNYGDINQVRSILSHIQNAGINLVYIDMTNPSQWTRLWSEYLHMVENVRSVCAEKNMEYFIMIGAVVSPAVRNEGGMPVWIKTVGDLEFWNMQAQYIWDNWASDSHYRTYGFGDDRKIITMFTSGESLESLWSNTAEQYKTYLSKFYRGTHQFNVRSQDTPTDGWGYRDIMQSSDGKIRFVSPTKGLHPPSSTHITAQEWSDRIDWAMKADHYSIYGSYDDNNDNIHWGINDTKNSTSSLPVKYPGNDSYYYYDVLKNKLTSSPDLSTKNPLNQKELKVFPNPAKNELNISFSKAGIDNAEALIYSITGRLMISQLILGSKSSVNIKQLNTGTYILNVVHQDKVYVEKIIKN